ncbi:MAG: ATP-binding protein [Endomicrobium sp.]|jgi:predicted AAA+ superfamily ATPase|nr:ATP-binding protein [Endomicrobium sp.]
MIERTIYLEKLLGFKDKQLIKIITGVRRCGKSTLLELYQKKLIEEMGIEKRQIQSINLEMPEYRELLVWDKLYDYINSRLIDDKKNYIFIDEIQNAPDFQRAADGLFIKNNVDLYLTGSNSKMQSGEWATLLSGRYVEIQMFPLSFKEYSSAYPNVSAPENFKRYLEESSFPYAIELSGRSAQIRDYLGGIYNTIVLKDIVENKKIRDISRLEMTARFIADNIGNLTSIKKISDTMTSDGVKILPLTIESYIDALRDSYILYRASRYDVKGKKLLQTLDKYYLIDIGLRYYLLGDKEADSGRILENIVYLELLRRDYKVSVGKVADKEVDFVAEGLDGTQYYQVADTILDKSILARELAPLNAIHDHNPKFILTKDYEPRTAYNGIKQVNVFEWLLKG